MIFKIKSKALIFLTINIFLAGLYISLNPFSNRILISTDGPERVLKTLEDVAQEKTIISDNDKENPFIPPEYFLIQKLSETAQNQTTQDLNNDTFTIEGNQYHYDQNPFRKLGLYQEMPDEYYNFKSGGKLIKGASYYRIKHKKHYCDQVDLYNLYNPSNLFNQMNFISDYSQDESLIREEVMKKIGSDVMPGVEMSATESHKAIYDMAVNTTMMFFKRSVIHSVYEINKEWACNSQMYNHIPGAGVITRKDLLVETIKEYTQKYQNRPHCINSIFPQAYRLYDEQECQQFLSLISSEQYINQKEQEPVQYLLKHGNGPHRGLGLYLVTSPYEKYIQRAYENGTQCGIETKNIIVQKYISNPLLLDKQNKFDFRIYMLVASVNPLIVYYHDGFLRVSLSKYDKNSTEKNVHFTNTHLSKEIFEKASNESHYEGMTEDELRDYQMWTMEELQAYLLKIGKIQDQNWLDNYLRPKFREAFIHIARMAEKSFYKSPSVFEMYGLDFVIDEETNIWFIECNPSPQMVGTSERKTNFLVQMIKDLFEVQFAYLRSRIKRVNNFVHAFEQRIKNGEKLNYSLLKHQFNNQININRLEPEFQISPENSFVLIMDKNIQGSSAYFNNLSHECI